MDAIYNKHYIVLDSSNFVVDGFSDAFRQPSEDAICINEQGGYQFRLFPNGEENPQLFDYDYMIPLYMWDGTQVVARPAEDIEADRQKTMLPTEADVRAQRDRLLTETDWTQVLDAPISTACREAFRLYRQQLRDVTEQDGCPTDVVWPVMPEVIKAMPEPIDTVVEAIIGEEVAE